MSTENTACNQSLWTSRQYNQRFVDIARVFTDETTTRYCNDLCLAEQLLIETLNAGGKLLLFGNGGSAADAEHLATELVVRFRRNRRALPALALSSNGALITACANDLAFDSVFSRQIEALGVPGDLAIGISTSGKSVNVIKALDVAREQGLKTLLMTGLHAATSALNYDVVLRAPGKDTAQIQEFHIVSYHALCDAVEMWLCV